MEYFEKFDQNPYDDPKWNIPEQKLGSINIIGGNSQRFQIGVKITEFIDKVFPIKQANLILPDALKSKIPDFPNFIFLPSTESGSFADSQEFVDIFNTADFNLVLGDLSKNIITGKACVNAIQSATKPTLITRDTVDLFAGNSPELALMNENLILMASVAQLQKLLRAIYYPKMLLMTQSLVQVSEVLHKFTLSYPTLLITLHDGQILVAADGKVKAIPLTNTNYNPITFWNGELAAKITAINLYNPNKLIEATVCAIFD